MIVHYFKSERLQLHKGWQINLDVILLFKCQKTHTETHQIEIRFGVLKLFFFFLNLQILSFQLD